MANFSRKIADILLNLFVIPEVTDRESNLLKPLNFDFYGIHRH